VSKRRERRRDPRTTNVEVAEDTGRAGGRSPGRPGQARKASTGRSPGGSATAREAKGWSLGLQLAILVAVFAVVVIVAELAGAANLGVALGVGQIAFAVAVVYLLVRR
jgi:hypothetical protein